MDFVDEYYADKDLSLLKKLTLIVPTYNRNYYLSRCLWYHAHFPFGEIIVADSSPEEKKVVNRETVQKIREMFGANIQYLEYEPETEKYGGDIYRKWGDAVQHVETEYSQIVTDKEFIIPSNTCQCILYLSQNPDYSSVNGRYYNITYENGHYRIHVRYPKRTSENSEDPYTRYINSVMLKPCWNNSQLMGVFQSKQHKEIYNLINKYKIKDLRYGELVLSYTPYLMGKVSFIQCDLRFRDEIILFKRQNLKTGSNESSSSRYPILREYKNTKCCVKYSNNFREYLLGELLEYTTFPKSKIERIIDRKLNDSLWEQYWGDARERGQLKRFLWKYLKKYYIQLPDKIKKYCNSILMNIFKIPIPDHSVKLCSSHSGMVLEKMLSNKTWLPEIIDDREKI